ncbi:hypothetical protein HCI99_06220 [Listeria booriae]|uniref:YopX protein domain-containing protein n=1 Tax=Listeria booriae TaxID=1552123 RepID=A0A7X1CBH1_9LIST|nr:YopX family protein [Listeria booriae]MBC1491417.1 hypothetical protein [Listeria booriae]
MRPIEFRAWDETEKRWLNIDEFFIFYDGTIFLVKWLDDSVYDDAVTLDRAGEDIKLEQYTGLRDKNGNKIFEGDICWNEPNELYGLVFYDEKTTKVKFRFSDEMRSSDLYEWSDEVEIRGNIHDNLELLEGGAAE